MKYANAIMKRIAPVPIVPNTPIIQLLIMAPTPPPKGKLLAAHKKASDTDNTIKPTVTYFRFLQIENTLRLNSRLTPTTKKKVQISNEAIPNPRYINSWDN